MTAAAAYLEAATSVGLLAELDGVPYVAGEYVDPVSRRRRVLVEYCDGGLVDTGAARDRLRAALAEAFPGNDSALVRVDATTPDDLLAGSGWTRELVYVGYEGPVEPPTADVRLERQEDRAFVRDWLERAFTLAQHQLGSPGDGAAEAAAATMAHPARRTYVVGPSPEADPIGHATLLTDAVDEVRGVGFVELLDALVEPEHDVRALVSALVAVCAAYARQEGRPLVGHVVATPEAGDRVLGSLLRRGWRTWHSFYRCPLGDGGTAP